jgi:hypothetical protein
MVTEVKGAPLSGGLPAVPTGMSAADPDIQKQYSESIDKVLSALENRGGTNWFQIAGALANPGRTGSASEAFGRAMDVVGQQRQEEEKNALPIAQMRAQLVGQKYELAQQNNAMNILKGMYTQGESGAPVTPNVAEKNDTTQAATGPMRVSAPKFDEEPTARNSLVNTLANTFQIDPKNLSTTRTREQQQDIYNRFLKGEKNLFMPVDPAKFPDQQEFHANAIDVPTSVPEHFMHAQGWYRPFPKDDPVHYEPITKGAQTAQTQPSSAVAQVSQAAAQGGMWKPDPQLLSVILAGNKNDARAVLNEIAKVNIDMQKPTDLQRDLKQLQSGGSPIMNAGILAKYFGDAVKPFDLMTSNGTVQSTILQQLAPLMGQVANGQRPNLASLQAATGQPSSGTTSNQQGQTTVASLNGADRVDTGFALGSKEDLDARAKIVSSRLAEKDKEWLPQRAAVQTWNPIEVQNYENDLKLIDSVAKSKPHIFGQLQSQGALTALGELAQSGVNTPWGSVNMNVDKFLRTLNLDPKDKAIADDVGHAMARIFFANAKAYKSVLGPQISNSDATLMRSPMVTLEDQSNVIRHWVGQQILNNEQRLDLYKALNSHDNENPHASLGHFFTSESSPIFKIAKKYGAAQEQWRKISPLYNQ